MSQYLALFFSVDDIVHTCDRMTLVDATCVRVGGTYCYALHGVVQGIG